MALSTRECVCRARSRKMSGKNTLQMSCSGLVSVLSLLVAARGAAAELHHISTVYRDDALLQQQPDIMAASFSLVRDSAVRGLLVRFPSCSFGC